MVKVRCQVENRTGEAVTFTLPTRRFGARWSVELATGEGAQEGVIVGRADVLLQDRSLMLLRRV